MLKAQNESIQVLRTQNDLGEKTRVKWKSGIPSLHTNLWCTYVYIYIQHATELATNLVQKHQTTLLKGLFFRK